MNLHINDARQRASYSVKPASCTYIYIYIIFESWLAIRQLEFQLETLKLVLTSFRWVPIYATTSLTFQGVPHALKLIATWVCLFMRYPSSVGSKGNHA